MNPIFLKQISYFVLYICVTCRTVLYVVQINTIQYNRPTIYFFYLPYAKKLPLSNILLHNLACLSPLVRQQPKTASSDNIGVAVACLPHLNY